MEENLLSSTTTTSTLTLQQSQSQSQSQSIPLAQQISFIDWLIDDRHTTTTKPSQQSRPSIPAIITSLISQRQQQHQERQRHSLTFASMASAAFLEEDEEIEKEKNNQSMNNTTTTATAAMKINVMEHLFLVERELHDDSPDTFTILVNHAFCSACRYGRTDILLLLFSNWCKLIDLTFEHHKPLRLALLLPADYIVKTLSLLLKFGLNINHDDARHIVYSMLDQLLFVFPSIFYLLWQHGFRFPLEHMENACMTLLFHFSIHNPQFFCKLVQKEAIDFKTAMWAVHMLRQKLLCKYFAQTNTVKYYKAISELYKEQRLKETDIAWPITYQDHIDLLTMYDSFDCEFEKRLDNTISIRSFYTR